jgi:hypothetical protein
MIKLKHCISPDYIKNIIDAKTKQFIGVLSNNSIMIEIERCVYAAIQALIDGPFTVRVFVENYSGECRVVIEEDLRLQLLTQEMKQLSSVLFGE